MTIVASEFKEFFPEFASQADSRVAAFLNAGRKRVSQKIFGDTYELAVFYLAAHMLSMAVNTEASGGSGTGAKGNITSEKVGDLSIGYSSTPIAVSGSGSSTQLMETAYGRQYVQLRKEKTFALSVANSGVDL